MTVSIRPLAALVGSLAMLVAPSADAAAGPEPAAYDLVIRGGRLLDGAGNPYVLADLAIDDGRIVALGRVTGRGEREFDARGQYVSPGFIDMMDQSGAVLLENGAAENKLRMGVTTVIAGEGGTPVEAARLPEYFGRLEQQGIGVNFGTYYSASQARVRVMGDTAGAPTEGQLAAMREEVGLAMQAGAFGITTALIYPPESFQSTADLIELARVAAQCDGLYATHMRDESAGLLGAIDEAIAIGEGSGARVEIFHLKAAYAPGFGELMPQAIARIQAARDRGVDIAADVYPYTAGGTGLSITVPNWVFEDGADQGHERLSDPAVRARLKRELAEGSQPGWSNLVEASGGWDGVVLVNAFGSAYEAYHHQSIADIATSLGRDPADVAWDIVLEALPNRAMALFFMMDEADVRLALRAPWTSIGSDAAASEIFGETDALGLPHPRAYGTFVRVLAEYVRDERVLTLEDAVRKMTSWPAARMGLHDRGLLRPGMKADVVVFDLDRLEDRADWRTPSLGPAGVNLVVVNGEVAIDGAGNANARSGEVLRHGGCRT